MGYFKQPIKDLKMKLLDVYRAEEDCKNISKQFTWSEMLLVNGVKGNHGSQGKT